MLERSATPAQNISKISTGSTQVRHISGDHAVRVLGHGMTHQERITYLEKLGLEKLVDVNNTLYTQIMCRNPVGIYKREADIEQAIHSLVKENNLVIYLETTRVNYLDITGERQISYLGISAPSKTQY